MYRLSPVQKTEIAQNLIDIFQKDEIITKQAKTFIVEWIYTAREGKVKAHYDVWDIVLKNYLPTKRPVLFRSCDRFSKDGKIVSFSGEMEFVRRYSKGKGCLIICDTKETLLGEEIFFKPGTYQNSFYPLVDVLKKAQEKGDWGFNDSSFEYIGEDEHIMRNNFDQMHLFKWRK
jgi:hypothetical protein